MHLNQVHRKFASIDLEGWDGTTWTPNIAKGSMEVYSRFITERTFGAVKRLFMMPEAIDSTYKAVRMPDGKRYLIANESRDLRNNTIYGYTYLLQEVIADANIVTITEVSSASGMGSTSGESLGPLLPCYYERYGSTDSREVSAVEYSKTRIVLPTGTVIGENNEVEIEGLRFTVREVDHELSLVRVYGIEK